MIERQRRVVLLIDYDNLQICASRDTPGRELQLTPVVQLAQRYGTVILARAYAEWNLSTERLAVYKAGIEPAFAPVLRTESDRSGKSLADTVMVAEGMDMLWTLSPEVVVLATSDKDLIPLVRVAKQRGAFVVVLGSDFTAIPLREMADEHITYRQLITDASGRFATEAGPGRQPAALPEPTRRRTRDRNGRERALTPPAAGAPAAARPERESSARPEREATPRAEPAARPEREAAPRTEREPATASSAAAEPVAPVTAGAPGDADGSTGPRRRRRRGSRRRSDRLGVGGEGGTGTESGYGEGAQADSGDDDDDEITPTTSAGDVARASDATIERTLNDSPESGVLGAATGPGDSSADAASGAADVRGAAAGSGAGAEAATGADGEAGADGGAAAPRTRRRRTSLRAPRAAESTAGTPEASAPTSDQSPAGESSSGPSASGSSTGTFGVGTPLPSGASPVPEQSADILPAPPPEGSSTNGPTSDDAEAASTPARRPRRVASASRGRTRRP